MALYRGSRKHVLDWVDQTTFADDLARLVRPVDVALDADSIWMPRGHLHPDEARLETFGPKAFPNSGAWSALCDWWLMRKRGANTPNWDIAASCKIEDVLGLILVEAKANIPELGISGKRLDLKASSASTENHVRIGQAISEANDALRATFPDIAISRDSHYQLANRVAFAWKLATLGVPTVLVYLGFLGDQGIADAGSPFDSEKHWREVFHEHTRKIIPVTMLEKRHDVGPAPFWILLRSRQVLQVSPPRPPNSALQRTEEA